MTDPAGDATPALEPGSEPQPGARTRGGRLRPSVDLAIAVGAFAAAWILAIVWTGPDEAVAAWVAAHVGPEQRSDWLAASWPGDTLTGLALGVLAAAACGWLREWRAGVASLLAVGVTAASIHATKLLVGRARPEGAVLDTHAFPSGHAATAMLAWGLLALVALPAVARHLRVTPRARLLAIGAWIGLAAATGACRVLGGVHWASDVLAGWAFGGAILAVTVRLARTDRPPPAPSPA